MRRACKAIGVALVPFSFAFAFASATSSPARADNSAAVEALFTEGKRLMAEGNYAQACPKLLASFKLDEHRAGTLLNLADCYEKSGKLASAWARFVEARVLATRNNQPERVEFATQHASNLQPRLSKLTILAPKPLPGMRIFHDGIAIDPGALGVAVPVDGGEHTIEATAPDMERFVAKVQVLDERDAKQVSIVFEPVRLEGKHDTTPPGQAERQAESGMPPAKLVAIGLVGVGVIGLGVGTYFGMTALGKKSDSDAYCGQAGHGANDCYAQGVSLRDDAVSKGRLSTIFLVGGSVAAAAGVVLWLTAPSSAKPVSIGAAPNGVLVSGAF